MNCPYCNKEMTKGFIKSTHLIFWGENKTLSPFKTQNDYILAENNFSSALKGMFVESYYCHDCKKLIASFDNK